MRKYIFGVVGMAFLILKLTGVVTWAWWIVLLPFCSGLLIGLGVLFFSFMLSWLLAK